MAVIKNFQRSDRQTFKLQPTQVVGFYGTFGDGQTKVLQIDTLGSEARENRQKQSQTFQLDVKSAEQLWRLLEKEFGFSA
ncbi:hypothetical protein E4M02_12825 [Brevundimonas sp. S30B]|uniref:hypothetical protein n=1 Tax=unclassified Brevundimonas TaxID=2622653 RepID=UPI001072C507|nr:MULTISPECIES: hypothetical protein [unclassified Brevundimonas]QBX36536.1 hypothetical protein E4M01_01475 [Brevundimonas sp. MF30-B]TFW00836.1 hypothetical protein E4M02_12825 [Brevundimonas sp. S30B]